MSAWLIIVAFGLGGMRLLCSRSSAGQAIGGVVMLAAMFAELHWAGI